MTTADELIEKASRVRKAIYIAADKVVADDVADTIDLLVREIERLTALTPAAVRELVEAGEAMIAEQVEYMTRNHLGDPEKQHNIIRARAAIAGIRGMA